MPLPTKPEEPTLINPTSLLLYGLPFTGKTTFLTQLPEPYLILDLDGTSKFMKCCSVLIGSLEELVQTMVEIRNAKNPYKYVAIDSISKLEEFVMNQATKQYNASVTSDKKINHILDLQWGAGHRIVYAKFIELCFGSENNKFCLTSLAPNTIFIGHTKDKWTDEVTTLLDVKAKKSEEKSLVNEETDKVLDLTGKLAAMFLRHIHAVGLVRKAKKGETGKIDFNGTDDTYGARCPHLRGKTIERDWSLIYV